jgi:formylglycine-generating enzyme required for sulfatase activity
LDRRSFQIDQGKGQIPPVDHQTPMAIPNGTNPSRYIGLDRPVDNVSYNESQTFLGILNAAEGNLYPLPTEAEWEYACKAGTTTAWSHGTDEGLLANYAWFRNNNNPKGTKAVGTKLENPWGFFDMHGNVYELCEDWEGNYSDGAQTDPKGPSTGTYRIIRGGAYVLPGQYLRSSVRNSTIRGRLTINSI